MVVCMRHIWLGMGKETGYISCKPRTLAWDRILQTMCQVAMAASYSKRSAWWRAYTYRTRWFDLVKSSTRPPLHIHFQTISQVKNLKETASSTRNQSLNRHEQRRLGLTTHLGHQHWPHLLRKLSPQGRAGDWLPHCRGGAGESTADHSWASMESTVLTQFLMVMRRTKRVLIVLFSPGIGNITSLYDLVWSNMRMVFDRRRRVFNVICGTAIWKVKPCETIESQRHPPLSLWGYFFLIDLSFSKL